MLLAGGDPLAAAVLAERSARHADGIGARIDAARARLLAGRAHGIAGDRRRAASSCARLRPSSLRAGRIAGASSAVRELRRIGLRMRGAGPARRRRGGCGGLPSLSGREYEVATLVRDRKTNRQIAGELFLSEKTVESHMRSIFVKLGVDARADVARRLEQVG